MVKKVNGTVLKHIWENAEMHTQSHEEKITFYMDKLLRRIRMDHLTAKLTSR